MKQINLVLLAVITLMSVFSCRTVKQINKVIARIITPDMDKAGGQGRLNAEDAGQQDTERPHE